MPTTFERIQVTRDQRVEHLLTVGAARFPGRRPGRLLVELAAERVAQLEHHDTKTPNPIPVFHAPGGRTLTREMVAEALDDE